MNDRLNLYLALAFMVFVALLGGASRPDALSQTPLRLIAILFLAISLWTPNRVRMSRYRPIFVFLGVTALLVGAHLIPMPYEVWAQLPGRAPYAEVAALAEITGDWRPLSLTPGLTWNALLSLLIPLTMLVLASQVPVERLPALVIAVLVLALIGMILGHAQVAGGETSGLRLYHVTNKDSMVGLFANRNHHTVLLAMAIPLLLMLAAGGRENRTWRRIGLPLAALGMLIIGGTLLLAGSRAGLLAGAVGALGGSALYASMMQSAASRDKPSRHEGWRALVNSPYAVPLLTFAAIISAATAFAGSPAMQRLLQTGAVEEDRARLFAPMLELARAMFPVGSGFGSFARVYPRFEPVDMLRPTYLNHAHNDLIELTVDGGLVALILLVAFLAWWSRASFAAWRQRSSARIDANLGRVGSITTGIGLLASLVDYPLRTPLHMAVFIIGCVLLQRGRMRPPRA